MSISGLITTVPVDQGDRVEAGQVLVRLDDSDLSRQVEVSESTRAAEVVARDATLSVQPGQCVALIGPSGAGKSTFLTAVGLINPPTRGRICIGGRLVMDGARALTNPRTFRRKHIGYVSQKANLIRFLTARENVQVAMELNGESGRAARSRALELLDYLGVRERADGYPPGLSGGEQQRVAVDVFDTIYQMEDGIIRRGPNGSPASAPRSESAGREPNA